MLAYCDYIAKVINDSLKKDAATEFRSLIGDVGKTQWDCGPNGEFLSTKKTISVVDKNGKCYRVTVEEI